MTKIIELEDIQVRFLKVFLPGLKVSDKCPKDEIQRMKDIRDDILKLLD